MVTHSEIESVFLCMHIHYATVTSLSGVCCSNQLSYGPETEVNKLIAKLLKSFPSKVKLRFKLLLQVTSMKNSLLYDFHEYISF